MPGHLSQSYGDCFRRPQDHFAFPSSLFEMTSLVLNPASRQSLGFSFYKRGIEVTPYIPSP